MINYIIIIVLIDSKEYDGALDSVSVALTASFNRRGSLLAVGCNDGRVVVWDFLTRGIAKIISAHVHPVTSVRLVGILISQHIIILLNHHFGGYS